jgi:hypothetical protein
MKTLCWSVLGMATASLVMEARAQAPEPSLPRPGTAVVSEVTGEVFTTAADQRRAVKADERLRIGSTVSTGRKSVATVLLSNGAKIELGAEAELEIEEFGQAPVSSSVKFADLKEEPTISRTRLNLLRGDVVVEVKPLKVARGSSFVLTTVAGSLRVAEGTFRAMVRMSDLGLGVATLELLKGAAEFELPGASFQRVPVGQKFAFALETDKATGVVKVGEMPKAPEKK